MQSSLAVYADATFPEVKVSDSDNVVSILTKARYSLFKIKEEDVG